MQYSTKKLAEHKLIILHLLQKMGISLSNSEICQFLLEKNYMDYFSVQQYLAELESAGWLEKMMQMLWVILTIVLPCFQFVAGILPLLFPNIVIKTVGIIGGRKAA